MKYSPSELNSNDVLDSLKVLNPIEKINAQLNNKKILSKKDMLEINVSINSLSDNLKIMCENIKKKRPNMDVNYSEKDKKCVLKASIMLGDMINNMELKKTQDNETQCLKDKFFQDIKPTRHLIVLNDQFANNINMMQRPHIQPPSLFGSMDNYFR